MAEHICAVESCRKPAHSLDWTIVWGAKRYWFCSERCYETFRDELGLKHAEQSDLRRKRLVFGIVFVLVGIAMIVLGAFSALGKDDGRYANSPYKAWFKAYENPRTHQNCCDVSDCHVGIPYRIVDDDTREARGWSKYQAEVDGTWVDVPLYAVTERDDKPFDGTVGCYSSYPQYGVVVNWFCFTPAKTLF